MLEVIPYVVVAVLGALGFKFMTLPRNSWVGVTMVIASLAGVWVVSALEASIIGFALWAGVFIVAALSAKKPVTAAL